MIRSPLSVTLGVWHGIFLREALDRLFDMRFAWFWLLIEPVMHIGFMVFVFSVIRMRTVGNADIVVWIIVGMLAFFLFRRTATQVTYAVDSNRPLFAYRQVKPFDPAIARATLEALIMALIAGILLLVVVFLGKRAFPDDALLVLMAVTGLWFFAIGYGLIASVLMELAPEAEHVLKILMMPLYLISGAIMPMVSVPMPYRDILMINPIAHGLELVRQGYFPNYHTAPGLSMAYLYAWALVSIFLGLLLYRRFALQLVMR